MNRIPRSFLLASALLVAACSSSGSYRVKDAPRPAGPDPEVEVTLGTYGVPLNDDGDVLTTVSSLASDASSVSVLLHYPNNRTVLSTTTIVVKDPDADLAVLRLRNGFASPTFLADLAQLRAGDPLYGFGREADRINGLCFKARAGSILMPYPDVDGPGSLNGTLIARINPADEASEAPMPCPIMAGEGVLDENGQLVGIVTKYRVTRNGIQDGVIVIPADRIARFLVQHRIAYTVIAMPPDPR
jgi:hypothetical protein